MLGVELVRDRATREPAKQETADVLEACREMSVLVGKGGLDGNVLRIKPPMCITKEDADYAVEVLDHMLPEDWRETEFHLDQGVASDGP